MYRQITGTSTFITKSDTAGEVIQALIRSIGIAKVACIDVEVYHASPNAD
jgi:hypothetical protein